MRGSLGPGEPPQVERLRLCHVGGGEKGRVDVGSEAVAGEPAAVFAGAADQLEADAFIVGRALTGVPAQQVVVELVGHASARRLGSAVNFIHHPHSGTLAESLACDNAVALVGK